MSHEPRLECRLTRAARLAPQRPAIITPQGQQTFDELDRAVTARAAALQAQGLGAGAWTALRIATTPTGVIDWLAILRAGARALPVSERLPEASLEALLSEHAIPALLPRPGEALRHTGHGIEPAPAPTLQRRFEPTTPCSGIATSGSTGAPQVMVHSYANHVRSAQGAIAYLPLAPGDRYLLSLPLFHVGGLGIIFRCLEAAAPMVLGGRAEDTTFLNAYRVTHVSMVETQLRRLLREASAPLPALRCVLLGGGPVAPDLLEEAAARGLPCYMSYGLTEMTAQVATWPALRGGGRVLPYRELAIDEAQEICVRGETLCLGRLDCGSIQPLTDDEGWYRTRDLGRWCEGRLEILGRRDNQFISGGENIQPEAVEGTLRAHPAISDAVVVPRRDPEFGQRPVAFLHAAGSLPTAAALRDWLRQHLPPPMVPVAYYPLPAGDGLKVRRRELAAEAERLREAPPPPGA
ncbi:MAG: AMP-binding protein [Halorhodospira sp.]